MDRIGAAWYNHLGLTLNPNVDVVLRLLNLASVVVGFGERVCDLLVFESQAY